MVIHREGMIGGSAGSKSGQQGRGYGKGGMGEDGQLCRQGAEVLGRVTCIATSLSMHGCAEIPRRHAGRKAAFFALLRPNIFAHLRPNDKLRR